MALQPAICTQCGGQIQVDDSKEAGICPNCGTPFITEKVIQNITNVTQNNFAGAIINMKTGPKYENALKLARNAREIGDTENAIKYYEQVREETPEIWDAEFYYPYYRALNAGVSKISEMTALMTKAMKISFKLLRGSDNEDKKENFIKMANDVIILIENLATPQIKKMGGLRDIITIVTDDTGRLNNLADLLDVLFQELLSNGEDYYDEACQIYIKGINTVLDKRGFDIDFMQPILQTMASMVDRNDYKQQAFDICKYFLDAYNDELPKDIRKNFIRLCKIVNSSFKPKMKKKTRNKIIGACAFIFFVICIGICINM